jgi:hypothetical protein
MVSCHRREVTLALFVAACLRVTRASLAISTRGFGVQDGVSELPLPIVSRTMLMLF